MKISPHDFRLMHRMTYDRTHAMKLIFSCAALGLLLAGCGQSSRQPSPTYATPKVRTDIGPISNRLPKLGPLQSVWWTSVQVTVDSALSPPSQGAYRVRGFARLKKEAAEKLSQQFPWQRTSPDWKPLLSVTNLDLKAAE